MLFGSTLLLMFTVVNGYHQYRDVFAIHGCIPFKLHGCSVRFLIEQGRARDGVGQVFFYLFNINER